MYTFFVTVCTARLEENEVDQLSHNNHHNIKVCHSLVVYKWNYNNNPELTIPYIITLDDTTVKERGQKSPDEFYSLIDFK